MIFYKFLTQFLRSAAFLPVKLPIAHFIDTLGCSFSHVVILTLIAQRGKDGLVGSDQGLTLVSFVAATEGQCPFPTPKPVFNPAVFSIHSGDLHRLWKWVIIQQWHGFYYHLSVNRDPEGHFLGPIQCNCKQFF